jgi:hypothetical protein
MYTTNNTSPGGSTALTAISTVKPIKRLEKKFEHQRRFANKSGIK